MASSDWIIVLGLAAMAAVTLWRLRQRTKDRTGSPVARDEEATVVLRSMALIATAETSGVAVPESEHGVWDCIADLSFAPGAGATVVAIVDGNASIYWGSSGGVIGGVGHETVRRAAQALVIVAETFASQMNATGIHVLPTVGNARIYAHARSGLLSTDELSLQALSEGSHPMSPLFLAVNEVITQLRLVTNVGA